MCGRLRGLRLVLAAVSGMALACPDVVGQKIRAPQVNLKLLADVSAVQPGGAFTLALRFEIEQGWHIYWRSPGDSGLPPSVEWKAPGELKIGALQFPAPRLHRDKGGLETNVLEGEPVLLIPARGGTDLKPGSNLEIAADVTYLVCKELCVRQKKTVTLTLPVAETSKPANKELFDSARRTIPIPAGKAKYVRLSVKPNVDRVRPGDKFKIALVVDIDKDHHIAGAEAKFFPTQVFLDAPDAIELGRPVFPKAQVKQIPNLGTTKGYAGRAIIQIPYKALDYLKGEKIAISGLFTYQTCDDKKGVCFPPITVEWTHDLPVGKKTDAVTPINTNLFGSTELLGARKQADVSSPSSDSAAAKSTDRQPTGRAAGFSLDGEIQLADKGSQSLLVMIFLAVLAGLVLNVTPCVLPVISIKVLSFVQQASDDPRRVFKLGLVFAAGMMVVFEILACLAAFAGLAWGQHFQKPQFIIGISAVIFAFALSMFGVFTLSVPRAVGDLSVKAQREGYLGAFFKGGLATVLGTPCLGPFLGGVLAYALSQPTVIIFVIFNAIGVGMAVPYVILTSRPELLRFVPKPGAWMETFKQFMGFVLLGSVVYLLYILAGVAGGQGVVWTLVFLLAVALACWLIGRLISFSTQWPRRLLVWGHAAAICLVGGYVAFGMGFDLSGESVIAPSSAGKKAGAKSDPAQLDWVDFDLDKLTELTADGKTVLVDFTADWCPNCKYNLKFVLNTEAVKQKFSELGAVAMLADYTAENEAIDKTIRKLGGTSVPLLAIFPGARPNQPIVLEGILTQKQVLSGLDEAGSSRERVRNGQMVSEKGAQRRAAASADPGDQ